MHNIVIGHLPSAELSAALVQCALERLDHREVLGRVCPGTAALTEMESRMRRFHAERAR